MKLNRKPLVLALLAMGMSSGVWAQSSDQKIQMLEQQLKALQAQIEELKQSHASKADVQEIRNQMDAQVKENVVVGDIPGSFRIPNTETSVRLYGVAELNMVHEMKGDGSSNDYSTFMPYMPLQGSAAAKRSGQTYMHGRTSRIGIEGATPSPYGQVGVKVEADFNNDPRTGNSAVYGSLGNIYTQQATNSYNLRLRHAYVQMGPWLVGQSWSTFMDIDNTPETVDFNGPIGSTFIRQPQIRYTYMNPTMGNWTVAIENPVSYVLKKSLKDDGTYVTEATSDGFSKVPDLVVRWDKPFTWGALSLRGVTHEHRLNDGDAVQVARRGYGLAASGQIKTVGDDFISWIVTSGQGIGRYFNYIEGAGYDAANKRIVMEQATGVVLGYQRKFSDTFRMNFVAGYQENARNEYTDWARANQLDSGQFGINRKVWQLHIGGIWNPIKPVDVGLEYIAGRRETLAGERGDMSRVNLLVRYNIN